MNEYDGLRNWRRARAYQLVVGKDDGPNPRPYDRRWSLKAAATSEQSEPSGPKPKELNPKRIALPETPDEQALDDADADDDDEEDEREAQPKRQNAEFHLSTPTFHVVVAARSLRTCERAVNRTRNYFEKRESQRFRTATRSVR